MAQLASALRSGRRGRVFESPLPDKNFSSGPTKKQFLAGFFFCMRSYEFSDVMCSGNEAKLDFDLSVGLETEAFEAMI